MARAMTITGDNRQQAVCGGHSQGREGRRKEEGSGREAASLTITAHQPAPLCVLYARLEWHQVVRDQILHCYVRVELCAPTKRIEPSFLILRLLSSCLSRVCLVNDRFLVRGKK